MIGIIGAMQVEVDELKEMCENKKTETISGVEFTSGKIFDKDVVIACCGIGKVFAAICTEAMILKYNPDVIINTGVGGTLTDKLSVCDVAVSENVVQHDMDTSPLGDPIGLISGINIVKIPAGEKYADLIMDILSSLNINALKGTIVTGDQFISSKEKKNFLVKEFDGISCEMEGGSIGHVCYVNKKDFVIIRAISDSADDTSNVDYPTFVKKAAENSIKTVKEFIRRVSVDSYQ